MILVQDQGVKCVLDIARVSRDEGFILANADRGGVNMQDAKFLGDGRSYPAHVLQQDKLWRKAVALAAGVTSKLLRVCRPWQPCLYYKSIKGDCGSAGFAVI
jgi:hypothetical protein